MVHGQENIEKNINVNSGIALLLTCYYHSKE